MTVLLVVKFDFHTLLLLHLFTLPRALKSKKECVRTVWRFESRLIILAAKSAVYAENVKSNHWMHNRVEQTMPLTCYVLYITYYILYIPALGSSEVLTRSGSLTIAFHCCTNQRHQLAIDTQLHWVPLIRQDRCNNATFNISMGKNMKSKIDLFCKSWQICSNIHVVIALSSFLQWFDAFFSYFIFSLILRWNHLWSLFAMCDFLIFYNSKITKHPEDNKN